MRETKSELKKTGPDETFCEKQNLPFLLVTNKSADKRVEYHCRQLAHRDANQQHGLGRLEGLLWGLGCGINCDWGFRVSSQCILPSVVSGQKISIA